MQEWRHREWPIPEPTHLLKAFNLIVDSGTRSKADLLAVEFTMHSGDIENLAGLPNGWFSKNEASVVQLTLKSDPQKAPDSSSPGEIVQFPRR